MDITRIAIKNAGGAGILVGIVIFLGILSLTKLPVQLFPDIERPQISIQTMWRAASPEEVESEIIEPQEEVLQGLPGLEFMSSWANQGNAWINLEFGLDTNMQKTLIEVISRMNRIPPLPRDALSPNIMLGGGRGGNPALIYFFLQRLPGNDRPIADYVSFFEDNIRPQLEAIPGVAGAQMQSGRGGDEEFQILFDPYRAAALGIELTNISRLLGSANDVSGGFVNVGRRKYTLRFKGKYAPSEMGDLVLAWRDGSPVMLKDIAEIKVQPSSNENASVQNGNPAISIRIDRESGANVLATLEAVKAEIEGINRTLLAPEKLTMVQSFDASVFIKRAVNLVSGNLLFGMLLAVGILWWFMRQGRATLIVAAAIPISLFSTFVVLQVTGRSLNVISLAGLAFAVGMVLDAAIVVLENIVRNRHERGHLDSRKCAEEATKQVLGALLASTATTVAIFIPVIFLRDVEGQLFADLALTIAIAVSISFIVAVTVLPAAASKWLNQDLPKDRLEGLWRTAAAKIMRLTRSNKRRFSIAGAIMLSSVALSWLLLPKLDYLPPVKRDAVDAYFNLPAGASDAFVQAEIVAPVVKRLQPYMDGLKQPALKNYYVITWPNGGTLGVRAQDQSRVKELETVVNNEILKDLPDTQTFAMQGNLFGGFGNGRSIDIRLQATDQEQLSTAAYEGMELINAAFPGSNVRPNPPLEQSEPQLQFYPNDRRMMEVGFDRPRMASLVQSMGDGLYVGEYFDGVKRLNVIFKSTDWQDPENLAMMPVIAPNGQQVLFGELASVKREVGPSFIQRIERRRTITLSLNPPDDMSLEEAMDLIKTKVEPGIQRLMPDGGVITYGGSADSLTGAISTMAENFAFAMALLFILMAGLFRSGKDSLMVLLSIPLATVGGVIAIRLLNLVAFQPMDLLTMIGFIILLGLVVNNAILLVHQTRCGERDGLSRSEAVEQALTLRLRPIFMSTLTSIFGMLPLLLMPGAGSVIYRGLAAVIVGGMTVSTLFTLILLPTLLQIQLRTQSTQRHLGGHLVNAKLYRRDTE